MICEINTIVIAIYFFINIKLLFCNVICALMFIISNHGIKCLSNPLQLEPCNVLFKVISDIIAHWHDICNKYNRYCNVNF